MKTALCMTLAVVLSGSVYAQDKQDKPYFDMDNCSICKCMSDLKDDMMKVKWEARMIDNGMLTVTVVPDDMEQKWDVCHENVEKIVKRMEAGEKMELCGFCTDYGSLMESGAKRQELEAAGARIMMLTSDDPAVVKKIHAIGKKMIAEHEKMKKMMEKMMNERQG